MMHSKIVIAVPVLMRNQNTPSVGIQTLKTFPEPERCKVWNFELPLQISALLDYPSYRRAAPNNRSDIYCQSWTAVRKDAELLQLLFLPTAHEGVYCLRPTAATDCPPQMSLPKKPRQIWQDNHGYRRLNERSGSLRSLSSGTWDSKKACESHQPDMVPWAKMATVTEVAIDIHTSLRCRYRIADQKNDTRSWTKTPPISRSNETKAPLSQTSGLEIQVRTRGPEIDKTRNWHLTIETLNTLRCCVLII